MTMQFQSLSFKKIRDLTHVRLQIVECQPKTLPATLQSGSTSSYPSCLAETSICPHSDSTSFVKLWQPRVTNLLPNYY